MLLISPAGQPARPGGIVPPVTPNESKARSEVILWRARVFCLLLAMLAPLGTELHAQIYEWTNFAGKPGGIGTSDGPGSDARFNFPRDAAVDSAGNIYVTDSDNHTIRKITPAGVVSTLAGIPGSPGSANGPAATAQFNSPRSIAVDGDGNLYIADTLNHTIRKITAAGMVSTLAGSPGVSGTTNATGGSARFNDPWGVAVDSNGTVYVADRSNHTIRKISPLGVVSAFAGSAGNAGSVNGSGTTARFNLPRGIAVDASGHVYVADLTNQTIRKITPAGLVSTLAGTAGSSGSTNATGSAARFFEPTGIAVDGSGNVFVGDNENSTVRKITPLGVVTTLAGTAGGVGDADGTGSAARFNYPHGVATDASGNVIVVDRSNHSIRKVTPDGVVTTIAGSATSIGSVDGTGTAARFFTPSGVAVDSVGNVIVVDQDNETIRKVTPAGVVTTLAGRAGSPGTANGAGSVARFSDPAGVAIDPSGNIYITDQDNDVLRKINTSNVVSLFAGSFGNSGTTNGSLTSARFNDPRGIAADGSGNLYITDQSNHTIRKITSAGAVSTLAGSPGNSGTANGAGSTARFNQPRGVAVDATGHVYVADRDNHTIRKITPTGTVSTIAGLGGAAGSVDGPAAVARFRSPAGVAVDNAGNVYVADLGNHTIRRITPGGMVTTIGGVAGVIGGADGIGTAARFYAPCGITIAPSGLPGINLLYVADSDNHRVTFTTLADPPTVLTGEEGQTTENTAVVTGSVNPNGTPTTYYFEYGFTTAYTQRTPDMDAGAGTAAIDVQTTLTGLGAGQPYNFRLVAVNQGGTALGQNSDFETDGSGGMVTAKPAADTGGTSSPGITSVILRGLVNPNGGQTTVKFEYGPTDSYGFLSSEQTIGNGTSATNVAITLTGLMPATNYHYRIVATNPLGVDEGNDATFTTAVPPAAATGEATNVTTTGVTLNGTVTTNDFDVSVSFEVAESAAALGTASAISVGATPASLSGTIAAPQAVTAINVPGFGPGQNDTARTYYYRTLVKVGEAVVGVGETVPFTVQNNAPVAMDDGFVIIGDDPLDVLLNDSDPDGDALRIVNVSAPTNSTGGPIISIGANQISYNPNDLFTDRLEGDDFTYTISDRATGGKMATAAVRVFSVKVMRGLYAGLISGDAIAPGGDDAEGSSADLAGRLDIMLSPTGQVTGSFKWQGRLYPFKGATLSAAGRLTITKPKIGPDGKPVAGAVLELALILDPVTRVLTGTLRDTQANTVAQVELTGTPTDIDAGTLPVEGIFNAVIDTGFASESPAEGASEQGASVLPRGVGFVQVTVKKSKTKRPARFVGRMPDAQPFSTGAKALVQALRASAGARYPLYVDNLYPKKRDANNRFQSGGFVSGNVTFTKATDRMSSAMNWERRANVGNRFPAGIRTGLAGFTATLNAIRYNRPAPGNLPANIPNNTQTTNARMELQEGDLADTITRALKMTRAGNGPVKVRVEPLNPALNLEGLKLSVNPNAGKFSGSFIHPADAGLRKPPRTIFSGVFQGQDGQGTFIGPTNTGRIQIIAQ